MKIQCPKCRANIKVTDSRERDSSPFVRCTKCKGLFFFDESGGELLPAEVDETQAAGPLEDVYVAKHRQAKRYLVLVVALLVAVIGYQFFEAMRKSEALDQVRRTAAKSTLIQLAKAQEQYYIETNEYTDNLSDLAPYFQVRQPIVINITQADASSWAATAYHEKSSKGLIFDSAKGGMQLEYFIRTEAEEE